MKLSSRFVLDTLFVIAAGFLAVATMTWSIGVAHWVAFAVSVGILVLAGLSAVLVPTLARKAGHGVIGLAAVWSIVAGLWCSRVRAHLGGVRRRTARSACWPWPT